MCILQFTVCCDINGEDGYNGDSKRCCDECYEEKPFLYMLHCAPIIVGLILVSLHNSTSVFNIIILLDIQWYGFFISCNLGIGKINNYTKTK